MSSNNNFNLRSIREEFEGLLSKQSTAHKAQMDTLTRELLLLKQQISTVNNKPDAGDAKNHADSISSTATIEYSSPIDRMEDAIKGDNPTLANAVLEDILKKNPDFLNGTSTHKVSYNQHRLFFAAKNAQMIQVLLDHKANINSKDGQDANTALLAALQSHPRDFNLIKLLVESKANVNQANDKGSTPLHILARSYNNDPDNVAIARYLINKGADRDRTDKDGKLPVEHTSFGSRRFAGSMGNLLRIPGR